MEKRLYTPRVIIHGGAGNIRPDNLPPTLWAKHQAALLSILESTNRLVKDPSTDALSAAVHAVSLFELNPLYNAGRGAVFTRTGTIELEASVMVSSGRRKRGAAVSLIKHVKHPINLAAEILRKGDDDDAGGAQGHVHISGPSAEELATEWKLELCEETYFWTRQRWEEHCRGLGRSGDSINGSRVEHLPLRPDGQPWPTDDPAWNGHDYLPQGTVGCVVMDRSGTVAVATSTGGLTNKLPGRIGDTPTFGAGFWAEEWASAPSQQSVITPRTYPFLGLDILQSLYPHQFFANCVPFLANIAQHAAPSQERIETQCDMDTHAVAVSGTGNGDSFLRLSAVRTASAVSRFSVDSPVSLAAAVKWMAGPGGQLQRSAEDRWGRTGEGEGGVIGIERVNEKSRIVADFNCGGMFRAWYDDNQQPHCEVFHD